MPKLSHPVIQSSGHQNLRTELGKVRGLGASRHAVGHWWIQRVTALVLIPLSLWFLSSLLTALLSPDVIHIAEWFASPVHAILMALLLIALFWHAKLGVQVVIEDYVHSPFAKYFLLLANSFINWFFAAVCVLTILKLHMLDVVSGV